MNIIKKAFVVASAAVLCAAPLAPSVANSVSLFKNTAITASAEDKYTDKYWRFQTASRANGYYESWKSYSEVKWIQAAYNWILDNYTNNSGRSKIVVDGYYGPNTTEAVKYIQRTTFNNNKKGYKVGKIKEDGYCGKDTQAKIKKIFY